MLPKTARYSGWLWIVFFTVLLTFSTAHARQFGDYAVQANPLEVFPGADQVAPLTGSPPQAEAFQKGQSVGYVFLSSETGYSGKPIEVLVGITHEGKVVGARVVKHSEPILLVGIPEEKLFDFVTRFIGRSPAKAEEEIGVDAISGATVTAIVIADGIKRGIRKVLRAHAKEPITGIAPPVLLFEPPAFQPTGWEALLGEGAIRRLHLTNADVNRSFTKMGVGSGEPYAKAGAPEAVFIDMYGALVTPEIVGRNLLGDAEYDNLVERTKGQQHALLLVANGEYSFRGSGFVRGGIFDRIKLVQDETILLFRDRDYRRLGNLAPGMPDFVEVGLFRIPSNVPFDPARPWTVELLVQRPVGPIEKAYTSFNLAYTPPGRFVQTVPPPVSPSVDAVEPEATPLWQQVWLGRLPDIFVLSLALMVLSAIFFFQEMLTPRPRLLENLRRGFLLFSIFWIGGYTQAQLSVVNTFTFTHSLITGFSWDFFLLDPLIFILWSATAAALLLWGRGAFCGWLCPFGALHEWLNILARRLGVRQYRLPYGLHERLAAVKYLVFLGLFGVSLHSIATAEYLAEIEPFKTVVLLRFQREWIYVAWAIGLLTIGLFIERFFCRYLCPLGAALAIPGRLRIFSWLKRRRQCGDLCSNCSDSCLVQAIQPDGEIHPNECIYCLRCQMNYINEQVCPHLIMRRVRQERRSAALLQQKKSEE